MITVHVICEGQTEETFVKELLYDDFMRKDIYLNPLLIRGTPRFDRMRLDIRNTLRRQNQAYLTTLIDFYGLPTDFPGKAIATGSVEAKSRSVCDAMYSDIYDTIGENTARRFIPYVQMHEFEALLFSDPEKFASGVEYPTAARRLQSIRDSFASPEDINDNVRTAPSKRILEIIPSYDKPVYGSLGAIEIGLATIRSECALFDAWLTKLENLST